MHQVSPVPSESEPKYETTPCACTLDARGRSAAWVYVAGELDLLTSPRLARTLEEARASARLTVLDTREVTFIDSSGVHAIHDASKTCEREGRRVVLISSAAVERMINLAGLCDGISTFAISPAEPPARLRLA